MSTTQIADATTSFGSFIRTHRLSLPKTARSVAMEAGLLPSNYCKIELGALQPPRDRAKLKCLADALQLQDGTDLAFQFYDLAAAATDSIPVPVAELVSRESLIPMMARTLGNRKLTLEEIQEIMAIITRTE